MAYETFGRNHNIHFIQRGWANSNQVVIAGDEPALIDTGHYSYLDETRQRIAETGVAPESLSQIVVTHSHWDHGSCADLLRQISGARVGMGTLTAEWMRENRQREMWTGYFGVDAPLVLPDFEFAAGDELSLGGMPWQVLALPGHSPDLLGFFQPDERILVSADSLISNGDCGVINVAVHGWEMIDSAENSLALIESLDPLVIFPGHGPIITDIETNIAKLRRRLSRFRDDHSYLATHFARRIILAFVLERDGLTRDALIEMIPRFEWVKDYAPMMSISGSELFNRTITELCFAQAMREEVDGTLSALVPR